MDRLSRILQQQIKTLTINRVHSVVVQSTIGVMEVEWCNHHKRNKFLDEVQQNHNIEHTISLVEAVKFKHRKMDGEQNNERILT